MKIFKGPKKLSKCFICEWLYFIQYPGQTDKTAKCAKKRLPPYLSFPGKRLCTDFSRRTIMLEEPTISSATVSSKYRFEYSTEPTKRYSISELFESIPLRDIE